MNEPRWERIYSPDGYSYGQAEVLDNGGGMGPAKGSKRWAVIVRGRWVANIDTLAEAKQTAEATLQRPDPRKGIPTKNETKIRQTR